MTTNTDPPGDKVEMPRPTVWPIMLSFGVALALTGLATSLALSAVGAFLFVLGLAGWIGQLLPGRGHGHEPRVPPEQRAPPIAPRPGAVQRLQEGMVGFRFRLPEKMHPISAGVKGGILGGLVMPIPALIYGWIAQHSIWFPVNLLAGMVLPMDGTTVEQLRQFSLSALVVGICIHASMSVTFGLINGVLSPMLPDLPGVPGGKAIWGGVLMPILWTGMSYGLMGVVNPTMEKFVEWHWFFLSQLVFGIVATTVVLRSETITIEPLRGAAAVVRREP